MSKCAAEEEQANFKYVVLQEIYLAKLLVNSKMKRFRFLVVIADGIKSYY